MTFNVYQTSALETAVYKESIQQYVDSLQIPDPTKAKDLCSLLNLSYAVLGLAGEAGELAGKLKKVIRDNNSQISEEKRKALLDENGDVTWYNAMVSQELDENYSTTAANNINKLHDRSQRGVLQGSGDKR